MSRSSDVASASEVPSTPAFTRSAPTYDVLRRRLVPCFDLFYGTALDLIDDWYAGGTLRVLDLGAGTGLFAAMILDRFPAADLQLIDASAAMLDQARDRFAGRQAIGYSIADLTIADLGGPWDLIVSALAIHHLIDDAKKALFGRIHQALLPGGLFVNAEQVSAPTPMSRTRDERIWYRDIRALGVSEPEIIQADERMAFDLCASVEDQLAWMREAGLRDVDCSFKSWRFAVVSGHS